ncbi:methyl-accepting chemotaxis protein [Desulfoscipio gibsoniae]
MKWYKNSILAKLLIPCTVLVLFGFVIMITQNISWMKRLGWNGTETSNFEAAKRASAEIESYLNEYSGLSTALSNTSDVVNFAAITSEHSVSVYKGKQEYVNFLSTARKLADKDANIFNIYFNSEKSQVPYDLTEWEAPDDYQLDNRPYYAEGKKVDGVYFSEPYVDAISNQIIVSITSPVYKDDKFLGLLGVDLSLETINNIIAKTKTDKNGYAFLLDQQGTFINHPDKSLAMKANATKLNDEMSTIYKKMVDGQDGWGKAKSKGEMVYCFYNPIKLTNWSMGVVVPEQALDKPIAEQTQKSILLSISIIAIVILCLAFMVRRSLTPLHTLNTLTTNVADGNLSVTVNAKGTDEISQLTMNFKKMVDSLKVLVTNIMSLSDKLSSHSRDLAATSQEVSATVEEVAGTTNEVAATSAQENENALEAAQESEHVQQLARNGNQAVQQTIDKINTIASASQKVAEAIQKLGEQSNQIGNIINTITNIADQTNLLALNAAIEAARAGEYGRGFAVVAEEVRQLAEQSASAATQITHLINDIQIGVGEAVGAIQNGVKEVDEGVHIADNAGASLEQIIEAIERNTVIIKDVAASSMQANENTQQLSASNEQIASTMQQVTIAAQDLSNLADDLQNAIVKFRV